ncbi:hypothetical protein EVAR_29345_1 [Eumeta japonica]|uniref:Uncharacterized protein n=1 Tax=Eumeta variegata TaxID=151549 RepID=A0A4C1WGM8_EUMVA|nr:hypothetical protein EVAR_29345_1 [Eumeta japonica]
MVLERVLISTSSDLNHDGSYILTVDANTRVGMDLNVDVGTNLTHIEQSIWNGYGRKGANEGIRRECKRGGVREWKRGGIELGAGRGGVLRIKWGSGPEAGYRIAAHLWECAFTNICRRFRY